MMCNIPATMSNTQPTKTIIVAIPMIDNIAQYKKNLSPEICDNSLQVRNILYSEYMDIITPKANKIMTVGENLKLLLTISPLVATMEAIVPKATPTTIKTKPITPQITQKMQLRFSVGLLTKLASFKIAISKQINPAIEKRDPTYGIKLKIGKHAPTSASVLMLLISVFKILLIT